MLITTIGLCLLLAIGIVGVLLYGNLTYLFSRPEPKIIGMTPELQVIDIRPMNEPIVTPNAVSEWATRAIMDALDIDAVHWKQDLGRSRGYFDDKAFAAFVVGLEKKAKILPFVRENSLTMLASPTEAAAVVNSGVDGGVYFWKIRMKLLVTYQGVKGSIPSQRLELVITVKRADTRRYPAGLKIVQVLTKNLY
ncbi:DotI/IcmL family type IV secretion protein [Thiolapillus sp.]